MNQSQFLIYISESGSTKLDVRLEDDTVWLSQKMMAELYQTTKQNINLHIQNIYEEGELSQEPTVKENLTVENRSKSNRTIRNFRIVQQEGKREVERDVAFYNLDMILSVGY
ncbi:MAG: virulence RhuM family protein [Leptospiraceae bacterium]|nr:virulence RhuM family protein [Leptospiraceae bacterium]